MNVLVTLNPGIGEDLGPNFTITCDVEGWSQIVSLEQLLEGVLLIGVPDGANYIYIQSLGICLNILTIPIETTSTSTSTTSTSTSSSTTTTTTTTSEESVTTTSTTTGIECDFNYTIDYFGETKSGEITTTTTTTTLESTTTTTTTSYMLMNEGFEDWSGGEPDYWQEVVDVIGVESDNITLTQEDSIVLEGIHSVKVQSVSPSAGIGQQLGDFVNTDWSAYPVSGHAAIHYAKLDGSSAYFSDISIVQENFTLDTSVQSTAIRNIIPLRLDNDDYVEIFNASSSSESSNEGDVYIKRNSGSPLLFVSNSGVKTWVWAGFVDLTTKYTWINMRLDVSGVMRIYATDIDRTFTILSNDRLLLEIASTNVQVYNFIKLQSGKIVIPIVYAAVSQVTTGPWYLDILTSDDDLVSVDRLNTPITYTGRGLMEAHPVLLSTGEISILCRTNQGFLAKAIYNPVSNVLSSASLTDIVQSQSNHYVINLNDGSILLAWVTATPESATSSYPRKIIVMAISSDDMTTWHSYHVLATSEALGDSMTSHTPYIHQPIVYEDGSNIVVYFERITTDTSHIESYKTESSDYLINNVANETGYWQYFNVNKPEGAYYVQFLNIIEQNGISYFDSGIATTTTTTTTEEIITTTTTTTTLESVDLNLNLLGLWELDDVTTALVDSSGNGHNFTAQAGVTLNQSAPSGLGASCFFNETSTGYAISGLNIIPNQSAITISMWFKSSDTSETSANVLLSFEGAWQVNLTKISNNNLQLGFAGSFGSVPDLGIYNDEIWHHLVAMNNGSSTTVYIDNTYIDSWAETIYNIDGLSRTSAFGSRYDGAVQYATQCYLSQIVVWDYELSTDSIAYLWNSGDGRHHLNW
jgi:hypothetical protein